MANWYGFLFSLFKHAIKGALNVYFYARSNSKKVTVTSRMRNECFFYEIVILSTKKKVIMHIYAKIIFIVGRKKIKLHQGEGTETEAVSYLMRHTGE